MALPKVIAYFYEKQNLVHIGYRHFCGYILVVCLVIVNPIKDFCIRIRVVNKTFVASNDKVLKILLMMTILIHTKVNLVQFSLQLLDREMHSLYIVKTKGNEKEKCIPYTL